MTIHVTSNKYAERPIPKNQSVTRGFPERKAEKT